MRDPQDQTPESLSLSPRGLGLSKADYAAGILRAGLGVIPFAGPVLTELINDFIPGQRTDRIAALVQEMDARLTELTKGQFTSQARTAEGADLIEDGLWMAARTLTPERRKAIANLLVKSLTAEELRYQEAKKLLQILNELQDPEIVMLHYFNLLTRGDPAMDDFYGLHEAVLQPGSDEVGQPEAEVSRRALYNARKATLNRLGLTAPRKDTLLSELGVLLIRYIGLN